MSGGSNGATSHNAIQCSSLVFVGTGVSTAVPVIAHLLQLDGKPCATCLDALQPDSRNRRNNVSLLIRYAAPPEVVQDSGLPVGERANILIDVGKTFRDACIGVLVPQGIRRVDAVLITHDHQDALGGADDLRDLQMFDRVPNGDAEGFLCKRKLPFYLTQKTMNTFNSQFPYIVKASAKEGVIDRRVAQLDFHIMEDDPAKPLQTFNVCGLDITGLPVYHGGDYMCMGYVFGKVNRVVYLSDVSAVPPPVLEAILSSPVDILILDCLHGVGKSHFSHFCIDQALELTLEVDPVRAYFVGMFCDLPHDVTNAMLAEKVAALEGRRLRSIELAYDGLSLDVAL